jgi:membrane protein required for colicin V production
LNPLDWLLTLLLAYSAVRAGLRGFLREAFALGGLVAAFLLACWNYENVATRLQERIHTVTLTTPLAQFAAFVLILLVVMLVATLLGTLLKRTASAVGLGLFDRLFGALFGLARGALLGMAVLLALTAFLPSASWIENSLLAPYFLRATHAVSFVMPSELRRQLLDGLQQLQHATPNWMQPGLLKQTGN